MIMAPAGTPRAITAKLHDEIRHVTQSPEIQQQVERLGMILVSSPSPEELQRFIHSEIARWGKVAEQAGIAGSE
jgi:tripartite-type tricarboxylate transporter receptor subunit TctC